MITVVNINDIVVEDRFRKELGDVQAMATSIKEFGLIQPAVIVHDVNNNGKFKLVAGGRRMAAMRMLGFQDMEIGKHVIIRDEPRTKEIEIRLKGIELEENLRRKDMTWNEQVEAKAKLFDLMVSIYGDTGAGRPTGAERAAGEVRGFGVRKLAAMLGESPATVSNDLQLAKMLKAMPHLAKEENKSSAQRLGNLALAVQFAKNAQAAKQAAVSTPLPTMQPTMQQHVAAISAPGTLHTATPVPQMTATPALAPAPIVETPKYVLYEGPWQANINNVADESVDLVYTDLPYGVDLDEMREAGASMTSSGHSGAINYEDKRHVVVDMLPQMMKEAYRVLRNDRFAVFFFGFNYYSELLLAGSSAGFFVNPVPVVWIKHSQSAISPTTRYANGYEQALVFTKGTPRFIRPGKSNLVDVPRVATSERLQVAQQPVPLVENFILDMTLPIGATVLDFCSGVGTTGVASVKNNRYAILFERDPQQCLLIHQRLENTKSNGTTN